MDAPVCHLPSATTNCTLNAGRNQRRAWCRLPFHYGNAGRNILRSDGIGNITT